MTEVLGIFNVVLYVTPIGLPIGKGEIDVTRSLDDLPSSFKESDQIADRTAGQDHKVCWVFFVFFF